MSEIMFETFKGNNLICIPCGEYHDEVQYLKMGYKKAKAIVDNIDEIEAWVIKQEMKKEG
jgi:hypothetical protein